MLFETRWYLRIVAHSWWTGFVAVIAGWVVTESGRQPWVVQGMLRTADATSPHRGADGAHDAGAVRGRLCDRVCDGHLLYQSTDRAWAAGPRGRAARRRARRRGRCRPPTTPDARRWRAAPDTSRAGYAMGEWDLPLIWAGIIGIAVALYVILDGFDLGVGILFPFSRDEKERDQMIGIDRAVLGRQRDLAGARRRRTCGSRSRAPMRSIMSALYLPVIVMLLALVFRGVAFEFRTVAETSKRYWNFAFAGGSALAAICQGVILGGADPGHQRQERRLCRRRVRLGDAVCADVRPRRARRLRAARRHLAGDEDRRRGRRRARKQHAKLLLLAVLGFMAIVSLWTPLAFERIAARWFTTPNIYYLWPVPLRDRGDRVRAVALARGRTRDPAVPRRDRAVPARLCSAS